MNALSQLITTRRHPLPVQKIVPKSDVPCIGELPPTKNSGYPSDSENMKKESRPTTAPKSDDVLGKNNDPSSPAAPKSDDVLGKNNDHPPAAAPKLDEVPGKMNAPPPAAAPKSDDAAQKSDDVRGKMNDPAPPAATKLNDVPLSPPKVQRKLLLEMSQATHVPLTVMKATEPDYDSIPILRVTQPKIPIRWFSIPIFPYNMFMILSFSGASGLTASPASTIPRSSSNLSRESSRIR
eukprot:scaffold94307_cov58-Attheya_sp.AAC.2